MSNQPVSALSNASRICPVPADSIRVYHIALCTLFGLWREILRDKTRPEWRYRLCGMITAPIVPTAFEVGQGGLDRVGRGRVGWGAMGWGEAAWMELGRVGWSQV